VVSSILEHATQNGALEGKTQETKVNELTGEINTKILCFCEIQIIMYLRFLTCKKQLT
jgi:hypothetical protein